MMLSMQGLSSRLPPQQSLSSHRNRSGQATRFLRTAALAAIVLGFGSAFLGPRAVTATQASSAESFPEPLRMAAKAFGVPLEAEVRDLSIQDADAAVQAAVREILAIEDLASRDGLIEGGIGSLHKANGQAVAIDPRLFSLLERAINFCIWSRGAHGPLGGPVYELWGEPNPTNGLPSGESLEEAMALTSCNNLELNPDTGTAKLAPKARLELRAFAKGFALDQAMKILAEHGSQNAFIQMGSYRCGAGDGPTGEGWLALLPGLEGLSEDFEDILLSGQCVSYTRFDDAPLTIAGDTYSSFLDLRNGKPSEGVAGVIAVTELAADAEGLAGSLLVLGQREGQMRLGGLKPTPSILWLLGTGSGAPLLSTYRWANLRTR